MEVLAVSDRGVVGRGKAASSARCCGGGGVTNMEDGVPHSGG